VLSAAKFGRVVYLGISHKGLELSEKAVDSILRRQLCILGSWNSFSKPFPGREWTESLRLFEEGKLVVAPIVSHRLPLEKAPDVFKKIAQGGFFYNKIMFFPWGLEK
jgi:L-iditol 2-dehydrogenase